MKIQKTKVSGYHNSNLKRALDVTVSSLVLLTSAPFIGILFLYLLIKKQTPVFFLQERVGKNGEKFNLFKFRTMIIGADKLQNKYKHLNVSDGPTFKIPNDPRYTKFGKLLVKTGLDELPQLINVIKGEMSLVGPRPFPTNEAKQLTKRQRVRELILPGITSNWVVQGGHRMSFNKWMDLDEDYVNYASFSTDIKILHQTIFLILGLGIKKVVSLFRKSVFVDK